MVRGSFETQETELFHEVLGATDVFINIGANIGYYCCIARSKGKVVVAFEPIALNVGTLLRNLAANGWTDQVEVYPLALSKDIGVARIYGGGTGASLLKGWAGTPEHYSTLVPSNTLDNVLRGRFNGKRCLILIDVEGAESDVLEGAGEFLDADPKPIWIVEIAVAEHQPAGVRQNPQLMKTFEIFWRRGYEAWTAERSPRLIPRAEISAIVSSGTNTLATHNFLFLPTGTSPEQYRRERN